MNESTEDAGRPLPVLWDENLEVLVVVWEGGVFENHRAVPRAVKGHHGTGISAALWLPHRAATLLERGAKTNTAKTQRPDT